jgi:hypothetical protein
MTTTRVVAMVAAEFPANVYIYIDQIINMFDLQSCVAVLIHELYR